MYCRNVGNSNLLILSNYILHINEFILLVHIYAYEMEPYVLKNHTFLILIWNHLP